MASRNTTLLEQLWLSIYHYVTVFKLYICYYTKGKESRGTTNTHQRGFCGVEHGMSHEEAAVA